MLFPLLLRPVSHRSQRRLINQLLIQCVRLSTPFSRQPFFEVTLNLLPQLDIIRLTLNPKSIKLLQNLIHSFFQVRPPLVNRSLHVDFYVFHCLVDDLFFFLFGSVLFV